MRGGRPLSPTRLMAREYGVTYHQIRTAGGPERLLAMKPEAREMTIATMKRSTVSYLNRGKRG